MLSHPLYKLGAVHNPPPETIRTLSERASLHLMNVPKSADWFKACPADGNSLGNDHAGNCVQVARYRTIQARLANTQGFIWALDQSLPIAMYARETGYDLATGKPDNGTNTNDDMVDWCKNGTRIDDQLEDVPLWVIVNPFDDNHLALAIGHCGPIQVTFNLPLEAQDLTTWSKPPGRGTGWRPGTWGEHRGITGAFDGSVRMVRTWGQDIAIHPEWWSKYVLGVDVTLSRSTWFDATGLAPAGLDWGALRADLDSLKG